MFFDSKPDEPPIPDEDVVSRVDGGVVYRLNGTFRLSVKNETILESDDLAYLQSALCTFADNSAWVAEWRRTSSDLVERDLGDGFTLSARKHENELLYIAITDPKRKVVGRLSCEPTFWQGEFILGERTVCGGINVDRDHWRKGFATILHDFAEEITGLPITTHGRNKVQGGLSTMGRSFWDKRETLVRVPGSGDPVVAERNAIWDAARNRVLFDAFDRTSVFNAIEIARQSGHRIVMHAEQREIGLPMILGWCVDETGSVVTGTYGKTFPGRPPGDAGASLSADDAEAAVRKVMDMAGIGGRSNDLFLDAELRVGALLEQERLMIARTEQLDPMPAYG
jgi:hypothetical protein